MNIDLAKLYNRKAAICDREIYKESSVLVPLIGSGKDMSLVFEVRSANLYSQPNEICFPGGKIEEFESAKQAAVRETSEELMIPESNINIIAELDTIVTPFNSILYTFAGELDEYAGTFNPEEVKEIFSVPLYFFVNTNPLRHDINITMKPKGDFPYQMIQKGRDYPWGKGQYPVYFYIYEDKIIWGLTARIINNYVEILKK
jgi:8-oxo-dGTP pyrophosphatase MutT (NUDIX family)